MATAFKPAFLMSAAVKQTVTRKISKEPLLIRCDSGESHQWGSEEVEVDLASTPSRRPPSNSASTLSSNAAQLTSRQHDRLSQCSIPTEDSASRAEQVNSPESFGTERISGNVNDVIIPTSTVSQTRSSATASHVPLFVNELFPKGQLSSSAGSSMLVGNSLMQPPPLYRNAARTANSGTNIAGLSGRGWSSNSLLIEPPVTPRSHLTRQQSFDSSTRRLVQNRRYHYDHRGRNQIFQWFKQAGHGGHFIVNLVAAIAILLMIFHVLELVQRNKTDQPHPSSGKGESFTHNLPPGDNYSFDREKGSDAYRFNEKIQRKRISNVPMNYGNKDELPTDFKETNSDRGSKLPAGNSVRVVLKTEIFSTSYEKSASFPQESSPQVPFMKNTVQKVSVKTTETIEKEKRIKAIKHDGMIKHEMKSLEQTNNTNGGGNDTIEKARSTDEIVSERGKRKIEYTDGNSPMTTGGDKGREQRPVRKESEMKNPFAYERRATQGSNRQSIDTSHSDSRNTMTNSQARRQQIETSTVESKKPDGKSEVEHSASGSDTVPGDQTATKTYGLFMNISKYLLEDFGNEEGSRV